VEFETRVPASGNVTMVAGRQAVTVRQGVAGRTLTIWVNLYSVRLVLDVHGLRIVVSWLLPQDLAFLAMRGARPTGPPPASAEIQRCGCTPVVQAVEVDRRVYRDRHVFIDGGPAHHRRARRTAGRRPRRRNAAAPAAASIAGHSPRRAGQT
jgi:hypothetical protein